MADWQSRTEAPTPRRREEARKRGQVATSQDLTTGLAFLVAALIFRFTGRPLGTHLFGSIRMVLRQPASDQWDTARTVDVAWMLASHTVAITCGLVLTLMFVSAGFQYLQAGPGLSWEALKLDWEKLSPMRGWQRIWSMRATVRGVLAVFKAVAIAVAVCVAIRADLPAWLASADGTLLAAAAIGWSLLVRALTAAGVALVALGLADYAYQRWHHEQELRMTREDLKEERRQEEGDPHMRARLKKVQREISRRSLSEVSKATVVITNPTHFAVAIRYDRQTMVAPVVVAKGADLRARRIQQIAREAGVPVLERKPLARALYWQAEVGQPIPVSLYRAVAEVLAYLYRAREKAG